MKPLNIVIIGGVAGGASAAAKARRVNEYANISIFEKGPYISFANCGLPYYVSGEIKDKRHLLVQTPQSFKKRFNIEAYTNYEAVSIDRNRKIIIIKKLDSVFREGIEFPYDKLILATGALNIAPPIPGIDAKNIFNLRTIPDAESVFSYITRRVIKTAVVLGGGYIGVEAAEALHKRGLKVILVEMLPQVLTLLDPDMVSYVHRHMKETGIELVLNDAVKQITKNKDNNIDKIILMSGREIPADIAIAALGVRPNSKLAKEAGLELSSTGAIRVNEKMQTSDPDIYAVGDVVESYNLVTKKRSWHPLAGPANKQGRVAGANAAGGNLTFKGVLGTAIVRFNRIAAAKTGLSEKDARNEGFEYLVTTTHSKSHAEYYPDSEMVHIKIVAEKNTRKLLGAQVVGFDGVDKRIDVLATALFLGATVEDLANLDLAYAPPYGSAKDPVNIAGMTAQNRLLGMEDSITLDEYQNNSDMYNLIDVRTRLENSEGSIKGSMLIPIEELRKRLPEIPQDKPLVVYCRAGYRGYLAHRILNQKGFKAKNIDGGYYISKNKEFDEMIMKTEGGYRIL